VNESRLSKADQSSIDKEDLADFWKAKGLSGRASNCLAKAGILDEKQLVERLTCFDDVLALRNCGRLTAEEIWDLIRDTTSEATTPNSPSISEAQSRKVRVVDSWIASGLSVRAANCLVSADIFNSQQLVEKLTSFDTTLQLKGCSHLTAEEIWKLVKSEANNHHPFAAQLVIKLQRFSYRPLTLDQCQELHQITGETPLDSDQLMAAISNQPELKVHQFGKTYVGLKQWTWFNPEKPATTKGQANLVEWFLRTTNEPASAKTIADEIPRQLGNFRLTPFEVANVCESQPHHFLVDRDDLYNLSLWRNAARYYSHLEHLLKESPLAIEQIVEGLSPEGSDETDCIIAALNRHYEVFVELAPFKWALKSDASQGVETDTDFGFGNLTFEDLIPNVYGESSDQVANSTQLLEDPEVQLISVPSEGLGEDEKEDDTLLGTEDLADFWKAKGLSVRAANCLVSADIFNSQ